MKLLRLATCLLLTCCVPQPNRNKVVGCPRVNKELTAFHREIPPDKQMTRGEVEQLIELKLRHRLECGYLP